MQNGLNRDELVALVRKIVNVEGSEEEITNWVNLFSHAVPHPEASGLIFWPSRYGLGGDPSPEQIVDKALDYKPIIT